MADAGGRVTMPFLPTLVTVALLAAASVYCTKQDTPPPSAARMVPVSGTPRRAMTAPAAPAAVSPAPMTPPTMEWVVDTGAPK